MSEHYNSTHEWARQEGAVIVVGLSAFAAGEVGDVIHVELPAVGSTVTRGGACCEIESVKSVNDFYSPVDGTVTEINTALSDHPDLVNQDSLGKGWFAKIKPAKPDALAGLLDSAAYQKHITK